MKIEVVDDTRTNLLIVCKHIELLGHTAVTAANGNEAIAVYKRERPDLILLDVIMPEMDGRETLRQLRAGNGEPAPLIAFMTGMTRGADRAACTDQGARLISKPINPLQLGDQIWALWQEQQRAA